MGEHWLATFATLALEAQGRGFARFGSQFNARA